MLHAVVYSVIGGYLAPSFVRIAETCRKAGIPLIVDAGIGAPSHAAQAMELGYDAVLLNTAVAKAAQPIIMARAFGMAIAAGRLAFEAGLMESRDMASPSTPVAGTPFFELGGKPAGAKA